MMCLAVMEKAKHLAKPVDYENSQAQHIGVEIGNHLRFLHLDGWDHVVHFVFENKYTQKGQREVTTERE